MSNKLSLGPLPTSKTVKHTIALNAALNVELEQYAALHSEVWKEPVDGPTLIPHIIEQFLRRDRRFKRWKQASAKTLAKNEAARGD